MLMVPRPGHRKDRNIDPSGPAWGGVWTLYNFGERQRSQKVANSFPRRRPTREGRVGRRVRSLQRLLRSHGLRQPQPPRLGRRLRGSYFGLRVWDSGKGTVDFPLPYGDWIRLFGANRLVVDDLVELRAPKHATSTYGWDPRWARRWPAEQIWILHKA